MSRSKAQPRPRLPSLLPGWLGRLLAGAIVVAGFLLADTVYLLLVRFASGVGLTPFAVGADTLPRFYQFMLLAHTGVGIVLVGVMMVFLVAHLPTVWRRYHAASAWSGGAYAVLGITLLVTGLFILSAAATRENQWAWWTHVVASSVVVGAYIVHRMVSFARPDGLQFARYLGVSRLPRSLSSWPTERSYWAAAAHLPHRRRLRAARTAMYSSYWRAGSARRAGCRLPRCRLPARSSPLPRPPRPARIWPRES